MVKSLLELINRRQIRPRHQYRLLKSLHVNAPRTCGMQPWILWGTPYPVMSYDPIFSITSQCPPLSGPTRRNLPSLRNFPICFVTARREIPSIAASASYVHCESSFRIFKIFKELFRELFREPSPNISDPPSSTFDKTTLNHVSWFSNSTRTPPCLLQASSIRFMPEPYRSVNPTALKSDANCGLRGLTCLGSFAQNLHKSLLGQFSFSEHIVIPSSSYCDG